MSLTASDSVAPSPFVVRAELALRALKNDVTNHIDKESRLCRFYGQWHENWMSRAEQLRQQVNELEARLAPWLPRDESLRLSVVTRNEESN